MTESVPIFVSHLLTNSNSKNESRDSLIEDKNENMNVFTRRRSSTKAAAREVIETMEESVEKNIVCVCCGDIIFDVRILTCGHMYCQLCINKWMETEARACPSCRGSVVTTKMSSQNLDIFLGDLETLHRRFEQINNNSKARCSAALNNGIAHKTVTNPNPNPNPNPSDTIERNVWIPLDRMKFLQSLVFYPSRNPKIQS